MLVTLNIANIALIDRMSVQFFHGLHVLSGETGAGKSIIVDAVQLLLGGRSRRELLRAGCDRAQVEGVFDLRDCPAARDFLASQELQDPEDENTLFLSREITATGRSVCRVNGVMQPIASYQQLTALLLDLHGQHAHQSLMDDKNHLQFLDAFGGEGHQAALEEVRAAYESWRQAHRMLEELQEKNRVKMDREDMLRLQRKELKAAKLVRGEEDELTRARDLMRNSEKIDGALREAYEALYDGSHAALDSLRTASGALARIAGLDEGFSALNDRVQNMYYEAEDVGLTLQQRLEEADSDPQRLEEVLSRLDLIRRLSRRYGATTGEMLDRLTAIEDELKTLNDLDDLTDQAEKQEATLREKLNAACRALTVSRRALAEKFQLAVEKQLSDLNMAGTRFVVQLTGRTPGPTGAEEVSFLIAPNRGEALQSLSRTASGGELSRLMLAIMAAAAEKSSVPSMIFDEVDSGISGRAAQVVADKMAAIAHTHQVLCVTHLQQIAARADHQYLVEKAFDGERTLTRIQLLDEDGRVSEIARMLGGDAETAQAHAREMLRRAD